jgi:hypothetical protein
MIIKIYIKIKNEKYRQDEYFKIYNKLIQNPKRAIFTLK